MASPSVVGTPAETAISTASTSHVVNLPAGATGNLLVAICDKGSTAATVGSLAGWNELLDENSGNGLYIAWRTCDGTEGSTITFTLSSSTRGAWIVYEITGHIDPATQPPQVGTTATGSGTTPNPPSVSVTGGSKDILTIACFGRDGEEADDDTWVTAAPSGFGSLLQKACGTAGTNLGGMVATAHLASTTATSDPGTFTCATGAWRAQTIVVHPPPPPTQTAVAEVSLDAGSTPTSRTLHSIKARARVTSGAGTLKAALYEGATNRSGDLESSALTTSLADYTLSIPDASAANITDYSNLSIRFWGYAAGGGSIVFEIDQLWLEIPEAGANTYTKTGALTPGTTSSGADVFTAAEAGSLTPDTTTSGAKNITANRAGSVTPDTTTSAADSFQPVETGAAVASGLSSGADAFTSAETGAVTSTGRASGADVLTSAETGSLMAAGLSSGGRALSANRAGSLKAAALASGTDAFTAVEAGALVADTTVSGTSSKAGDHSGTVSAGGSVSAADAFTASETGSVTAQAQETGADVFAAAETGKLEATGRESGADTFEASETGLLQPAALGSGADMFQATETGSVLANGLASGVWAKVGSANEKTGTVSASGQFRAADAFTAAETGSLLPQAVVSGSDRFEAAETGNISTAGRLSGTRDRDRACTGSVTAGVILSGLSQKAAAARTGSLVASGQVRAARQATFNRTASVLTRPISTGDSEWISSFRPVTAPFDIPRARGRVRSSPRAAVFSTSPRTDG